ncbi:hypothetical protein EC973_006089 [Apophysomyces ossiformis]|uniref:Mitochondrial assembly of ribosomal large subunit protein 1 n=1 Tax=Apophysomyces ossiformis TaxID=679940 RepID=A0A8H7EL24_9FUNG|nr:hypothetical protein EC973_006089 [Apophysomyces ossiformis]
MYRVALTRLTASLRPSTLTARNSRQRILPSLQPLSTRYFSQTFTRFDRSTPPSNTTSQNGKQEKEEDEDELEEIDRSEYPELYPEEEQEESQVDTEWFVDADYENTSPSDTDFIPLWQRRALGEHLEGRWAIQEVSRELMESGHLTAEKIKDLLIESKMEKVEILDLREKCDWTDYMIIAETRKSDKFLTSVADHLSQVVRKTIQSHPDRLASLQGPHIEGRDSDSGWLLIDLGQFVVHLFTPEVRAKYDLEGLWKSVPEDPTMPMPENI